MRGILCINEGNDDKYRGQYQMKKRNCQRPFLLGVEVQKKK